MCGIAGVVGARPSDDRIRRTLDAMEPRGPDSLGVAHGSVRGAPATLLHRRLSIIDLDERSTGPFVRAGCTLSYNGELYNYVELRADLEHRGHRFTTTSDTEVLIEAYLEWGPECVERFEGMWAFAILDEANDRLVLSRDRFGEKPLFTMWHDGALWFASQVPMLATLSGTSPSPDLEQVRRYLVNGYKALYKQPRTWFEGVSELPAGTVAVLTGAERPEPKPYWTLSYQPQAMTRDEAVERTRAALLDAVSLRLRADVPIALCLSGGIDSGTLAAIASAGLGHQVHAFSIIDKDPRYDELANIRTVVDALGIDHVAIETSTAGFFDRMTDLVAWRGAPIATLTYYLHSFLSEAISDRGYKVALSGTGADELFTGYYDHYAFWLASMADRPDFDSLLADWRESYGAFVQNPVLQDPLVFRRDPSIRDHVYLDAGVFSSMLRRPFTEPFEEAVHSQDLLRNRMLNELFAEIVPVILLEDDYNSMRYSVENRSPYLDSRLAELAFSIPAEHLVRDGFMKSLLRDAVAGLLPDAVRLDKRKRGFNAPVDSLVDRTDTATVDRLLEPSPIFELVDRERFAEFVRGDLSTNSFSKFLFSFISAKLFLEQCSSVPA